MNKKGAELSLNVIIIAVLVMIVLVVIVIIFSGRTQLFNKTTQDTSDPYTGKRCDIPGTGRYCAGTCDVGDDNTGLKDFTCNDDSKGNSVCCCCNFFGDEQSTE